MAPDEYGASSARWKRAVRRVLGKSSEKAKPFRISLSNASVGKKAKLKGSETAQASPLEIAQDSPRDGAVDVDAPQKETAASDDAQRLQFRAFDENAPMLVSFLELSRAGAAGAKELAAQTRSPDPVRRLAALRALRRS